MLGKEPRWGKKCKKVWRADPLCLFWTVCFERNRVTFDNEAFSTYRLKSSFICNVWSWSNIYSGDRDRSLLNFLTWMGYRWIFFFGLVTFLENWPPFLGVPFLYTSNVLLGIFC